MTGEVTGNSLKDPDFRHLLEERLLEASDVFAVDWSTPASDLSPQERLLRLASLNADLPPANAVEEHYTHDATLENYIRLALDACGDVKTLNKFLSQLTDVMISNKDEAQFLAQQAFWIWAPAAEIAGLYHQKTALEGAAFKILLPEEYEKIAASYDREALEAAGGLLEKTQAIIRRLVYDALPSGTKFRLEPRAKSDYSVWRKLRDEGRSMAQLFDLLGFRVIIEGNEDEVAIAACYEALWAVGGAYKSEASRLKDYIRNPKATGYQSLHQTFYTEAGVPFELQVRTSSMHERAENDANMSHKSYDAAFKETPGKIKRGYSGVPKLYRWRDEATASIIDNDGSTEHVLDGRILFFRPDGNMYNMESSATAIDASFRIHSRRALRTKRVEQDGRTLGFEKPVRHGSVIEVVHAINYPTDKATFDRFYLAAKTSRTRSAIKNGWRKVERDAYIKTAKEMIMSDVSDLGLDDPLSLFTSAELLGIAQTLGVPSFEHMLVLIGSEAGSGKRGRIEHNIRKKLGLIPDRKKGKYEAKPTNFLTDEEILDGLTISSDDSGVDCAVSGCCSGQIKFGDELIARVSRTEAAFKIHLADCNNVQTRIGTIACEWHY